MIIPSILMLILCTYTVVFCLDYVLEDYKAGNIWRASYKGAKGNHFTGLLFLLVLEYIWVTETILDFSPYLEGQYLLLGSHIKNKSGLILLTSICTIFYICLGGIVERDKRKGELTLMDKILSHTKTAILIFGIYELYVCTRELMEAGY